MGPNLIQKSCSITLETWIVTLLHLRRMCYTFLQQWDCLSQTPLPSLSISSVWFSIEATKRQRKNDVVCMVHTIGNAFCLIISQDWDETGNIQICIKRICIPTASLSQTTFLNILKCGVTWYDARFGANLIFLTDWENEMKILFLQIQMNTKKKQNKMSISCKQQNEHFIRNHRTVTAL